MEHFYDNSLQSGLMRDMAVDLELLKEHLVLLGNQVSILKLRVSCLTDHTYRVSAKTRYRGVDHAIHNADFH